MFFKLEVSIFFIILIVTAHGIDSHKEVTVTEIRVEEVNNDGSSDSSDSNVLSYDVINNPRMTQKTFYDAREDLYELSNVEEVALLKFFHPDGISSRERRASDCPLIDQKAWSEEQQMRVHVLPSKVPFSVRIKLDLIGVYWDEHEQYFAVRSSNLSIKEAEWSELSIKADIKDGKWGVTVTKNGVARFFQTDFSSTYIFDYLEVDIPSKTVKWYVGPKNYNYCDALIPTTVAPLKTPTTPTFTTRKTPTSTLLTPQVTATADSDTRTTSTSSKSMPRKGKMRMFFHFSASRSDVFFYI